MDSASVMRGYKSGLETRIHEEVNPHLVDIDGDACHHVHNITKKFCSYFENYVENLFRQIYTDFATSADSLAILKEITYHLGKHLENLLTTLLQDGYQYWIPHWHFPTWNLHTSYTTNQ